MSPRRTPFIAGNWKMYKTIADAERYVQALLPKVASVDGVEIGLCVPFLALAPMVDSTRGSRVEVFAQTMHEAEEGAFTGEVSRTMLAEVGVHGVVLGHSERRQLFGETDCALQLKVPAALEAGLVPILCVGETEQERERGDTERKLRHQVQEGLEKVPVERLPEVVLAYEPIWAIGTGLTATPEQAQEAVAFVRALVEDIDKPAGPGGPDPLRRLTEARERRAAARPPRRRRRARRRRQPRPRVVRAHRRGRARGSLPPRREPDQPCSLPGGALAAAALAVGANEERRMSEAFDYIVVGAGSAGCVLAGRLTEEPATRVLLIEAGGRDRSPNIKIPAAFAKQFHTKLDWDFSTEPEPHVDGRSLYVPRGKSLGGSSSMNAMLYVRGRPLDYDSGRHRAPRGWGWRDVQPYFVKSEDNVRGASEFHGAGGPLRVSNQRSPRAAVDRRLIAASEAAGIPRSLDYNGPEQDGVAMFQVNQRDGRRWSAADAFLRPALKRPNLEVMTRTRVLRVEFEGDRAVGVRIARGRGGEASARFEPGAR